MSGLEVDLVPEGTNGPQGSSPITRQTVEVVFDTAKPANGAPANPNTDAGISGRIARGVAALQAAGGGVGKVPSAASEAAGTPAEPAKAAKGLEVEVEGAEKAADGAEKAPVEADPAADPAEIDAAASLPPEVAQIQADLALARAQIDTLSAGDLPDEERTAWIDKPVDWIRGLVAQRLGVAADDPKVAQALGHFQWELTLDSLGVENLPKDLKERNDTEHAQRRKALAETARVAQGAAKTAREGREADRQFIGKAFDAAPDKYPHAAIGAEVRLGGMNGGDAAVYLWKQALEAGTIKNAGSPEANAHEALRLYNEFCKTKLGKYPAKNATPSPASTPAASKEAATGARKATTVTSKQAASAPAAKTTVAPAAAPTGPRVIDVSDMQGRNRRIAAVSRKHFGK